jgi:hypothetical protein
VTITFPVLAATLNVPKELLGKPTKLAVSRTCGGYQYLSIGVEGCQHQGVDAAVIAAQGHPGRPHPPPSEAALAACSRGVLASTTPADGPTTRPLLS